MAFLNYFIHIKLANQSSLCSIGKSTERSKVQEMLKKFQEFQQKAEIYYIYHSIHKYIVSL